MNVIVPTTATPVNSLFIYADVFHIGELKVLVDSGAKNSTISEEYRFIDGSTIEKVVGEVSLTVRYWGIVIDIPRVAVMRKMLYSMVLGVEWIVGSGSNMREVEGVATIIMPNVIPDSVTSVQFEFQSTTREETSDGYRTVVEEFKNTGAIIADDTHNVASLSICVLKVKKSETRVPIINTYPHSIDRRAVKGILKALPVEENEMCALAEDEVVMENATKILKGSVVINSNLTPSQAEDPSSLLFS
ncbi:hypothetical protein GHT06_017099 [Daphnia sinensis]|uniref:Uncharacterized protein n=1 Tax=Daphnia sinensis TaxID=1820382 RepID=A0AAD5KQD5_9CRUS|nr:hypothetical protein GHT06_017099 [Daphnia sinensis]